MSHLLFCVMGVVGLFSALMVVTQRKVIYSALFLILHLFSISLLYLLLNAPFLAITNILIYAGAIMVLFIFVIMLIGPLPDLTWVPRWQRGMIGGVGFTFLALMVGGVVAKRDLLAFPHEVAGDFGSVGEIGRLLFSDYLLLFELVSLLLLIGMIGVVVLGRKTVSEEER